MRLLFFLFFLFVLLHPLFAVDDETGVDSDEPVIHYTLYYLNNKDGDLVRDLLVGITSYPEGDEPVLAENQEEYRINAMTASQYVEEEDFLASYAPDVDTRIPERFSSLDSIISGNDDVRENGKPDQDLAWLFKVPSEVVTYLIVLIIFDCAIVIVWVKIVVTKHR